MHEIEIYCQQRVGIDKDSFSFFFVLFGKKDLPLHKIQMANQWG